jgi:NADH-quinone oxidoreductase subunit M
VLLALGSDMGVNGLLFDYQTLLEKPLPVDQQTLIFFLLFVGFAFKTPLFPFHTWLPILTMEGPVAIGVIMTGLKLGAYGLIRFTIPLVPDAAAHFHWLLAGLGVVGIIYGALMAMQQTNLRTMLAYSSISHIGLVVLSIASYDVQGVQGAVFQLLNFTVIATGMFLITGFLHARTESTEVISLGGVSTTMPLLASFFFLFGIASIGIPGTSGFPAEFMMLISALKAHTGAGIAALFGMILGAAYFLNIFRKAFLGAVTNTVIAESKDLQRREVLIVITLLVFIVVVGIYPTIVLDYMEATVNQWVALIPELYLNP